MQAQGKISFWSAVLMSINIIVGAGILFYPKNMAAAAGSLSFLGWPLVGLMLFPIILCIVQATQIFPGEGGFYNYCASGINQTAGFIAQWAYLLGYIGTAATMTTVLRENLISQTGFVFAIQHPFIFNALVIAFFSVLNLMSIQLISKIQSITTLIKMIPLFLVIVVMAFYWNSSITYATSDLSGLGLTIPFAIFGYWGFEACCSLGHLLEGGPRQVGKVILTAFFITVTLYTLFHLGVIHIMGVSALTARGPIAFPEFMGLSPQVASIIATGITWAMLLSFANSIFGVSLGNITIMYLLAQRKLIAGSHMLSTTNRFHQPSFAALVHGIVVWSMLCIVSQINGLTALTNLGVSTAFVFTLVALLLTNYKQKNYPQIIVTILGFMSFAILVYYSWISISPDYLERFVCIAPLAIGMVIGFALYKIQHLYAK